MSEENLIVDAISKASSVAWSHVYEAGKKAFHSGLTSEALDEIYEDSFEVLHDYEMSTVLVRAFVNGYDSAQREAEKK